MGPHDAHLHHRVPHLFEFLEDNYMVEWWDCDFRAWYYQPYRDRISRAFEAAKVLYWWLSKLLQAVSQTRSSYKCV